MDRFELAKSLTTVYVDYLRKPIVPGVMESLRQQLHASGLNDEAQAIGAVLDDGSDSQVTLRGGPWAGQRCTVGPLPPKCVASGSLWFDTVQLTLMVLIVRSENLALNPGQWIATHPVKLWQYLAFVQCVEVRRDITEFKYPSDLLSADRFKNSDLMEYATNIYHDEAIACAHWFGTVLSGQFDLVLARTILNDQQFDAVLPIGLRLWDEAEHPASEFLRVAVSRQSMDRSIYDDPIDSVEDCKQLGRNRLSFEEWERRNDIAFSTCVDCRSGLITGTPRRTTAMLLLNGADRSAA